MPKRSKSGRFVKGSGSKAKKRPATRTGAVIVALGNARRAPMAAAKRKAASPSKRKGRKSAGGGGGGGVTSNRKKMEIVGAGAVWGWATSTKKRAEAKAGEFWADKLPEIKAVGKDGTAAILAHFIAANSSGAVRKWADNLSVALAGAAAVQLGRVDFKGESLSGYSDRGEVSGSLNGDEDAYEHDA